MIKLILAAAIHEDKYIIGDDNKLPWHIKEELQFFKKTTEYSTVIMGYNTAKSLNFKPLPNRTNIVVCDVGRVRANEDDPLWTAGLMMIDYSELKSVLLSFKDIFVIGGANLYSHVLEKFDYLIDTVYISWIDRSCITPEKWTKPIEFTEVMYEKTKLFTYHEHYKDLNNKFIVMKGTKE